MIESIMIQVTPDISINTTDKPDGFATDGDRFFDDNFILLGAESEDATVDSNLLFSKNDNF